MRIRQIALVARELEPAVDDLCAVLGIEVGFRDSGVSAFGLENAVMPIGDTFLEVVSPVEPGASARRFLERRNGDGGYMVIVQSEDLNVDRARTDRLGIRIVWETTLPDIATLHLHPRDVGGAILSLDVADPPESWRWAGPEWKSHVRTDVTSSITGIELQSTAPATLAARWSEILDRPADPLDDNRSRIQLDQSRITFVPPRDARGDGIATLEIAATDQARALAAARTRGLPIDGSSIKICGTRFQL